ncbi:MAG: hypothetical protein Kow0025_22770 [Thermodesulfovibrionales bacterium]
MFILARKSSFVVDPWNVHILNDDWHTFEEVVLQVARATGCSFEQAFEITFEAHTYGEAVCFSGPKARCEKVAGVLREIDLGVRLAP